MSAAGNHPTIIEIFDDSDDDGPASSHAGGNSNHSTRLRKSESIPNLNANERRQDTPYPDTPQAATPVNRRHLPRRRSGLDAITWWDGQDSLFNDTERNKLEEALKIIQRLDRRRPAEPQQEPNARVASPPAQTGFTMLADPHRPPAPRNSLTDNASTADQPLDAATPFPEWLNFQRQIPLPRRRPAFEPHSSPELEDFDFDDFVRGSPPRGVSPQEIPPPMRVPEPPAVGFDIVLQQVLEIFPNICPKHVRTVYEERVAGYPTAANLGELVIDQIAEDGEKYPKAKPSRAARKRKSLDGSDDEDDEQTTEYMSEDRPKASTEDLQEARNILNQDFPTVPTKFIKEKLEEHKNLYPAYRAVVDAIRAREDRQVLTYEPLKKRRTTRDMGIFDPSGRIQREYNAVKKCINKENAARAKKRQDAEEDAALDKKAFEEGETKECECCFTDVVLRKMVHCEGDVPHFFCIVCVKGYVKAQLDYEKYQILCMAGCDSGFSRSSKLKCLDKETFIRLERVQQQAELREANVPGLETCPFCDFAAICPPIEEDKEFRCAHPECQMISCRLCRAKSHLPKSCEENKRDHGIEERHIVEEEMTKALIRTCPKCKVAILKTEGCNKVICSRCGAYICDVCGKDISKDGYSHFGPNKCAQYDHGANGGVVRENVRVQEAEKAAKAKIRSENPDISEADLEIKFSDAVKARDDQLGRHTTDAADRIALMEGILFHNQDFEQRMADIRQFQAQLRENDGPRFDPDFRVNQADALNRDHARRMERLGAVNQAVEHAAAGFNRFGRDNRRPDFDLRAGVNQQEPLDQAPTHATLVQAARLARHAQAEENARLVSVFERGEREREREERRRRIRDFRAQRREHEFGEARPADWTAATARAYTEMTPDRRRPWTRELNDDGEARRGWPARRNAYYPAVDLNDPRRRPNREEQPYGYF